MTDLRRAGLLGASVLFSSVMLAACGGAAPASTTEATPAPAATPAEATPEATATPSPEEPATPEAVALPSFDLDALSGSLPNVQSYRTSTSIGGVEQYRSVVVKEPELSKEITILDGGNVATRFIVIGDQAWMAEGANGAYQAVPTQLASSMLLAFDPALMLGAYANVDWATGALNQGVEDKNGIQAHHVRIDSTSPIGVAGQMPAGAAVDIWVANEGYLVAWEMTGFPNDANIAIQITNVNDPANKVEAPS